MSENQPNHGTWKLLLGVAVVSGLACVAVAALLTNIFERKQEARTPVLRVVELTEETEDPAVWGRNFPLQYDDYLKTAEMGQTRYGGSMALPNVPSDEDPRDFVARSKLQMVPQLKQMWAGYAFSTDYREARGHAYMLTDQMFTERQKVGQPGTCIHCHASTYTAMRELGDGNLVEGFEQLNQMTYDEAREHVHQAVACIDCHDPETMGLRITRPAFMAGIAAAKAHEGIDDYDVNTMATRQEMRSYICAQCHVEYYFAGEEKRLTYPWSKGLTVDAAYDYYEEVGFTDWTHAQTGAPMLKAQHPEFETWSQGIHARAGVSCADCHMPYKRVGATKISDHHVRSPLLTPNTACGTCHKNDDEELLARAEAVQVRHRHVVETSLNAVIDLIDDIVAAKEAGVSADDLQEALQYQRKATFYADYIEAENSSGFHAGQESARIAADAINFARLGQQAVRESSAKSSDPSAE
jgi:nitrite reductase (cytochrome c-552)